MCLTFRFNGAEKQPAKPPHRQQNTTTERRARFFMVKNTSSCSCPAVAVKLGMAM